jgi:hypothetical protein
MARKLNFATETASATPATNGGLEWENVMVEEMSAPLQQAYNGMLDARKGFEDAMIGSARKNKLIGANETLLFGYKFRGRVSVAAAPIQRQAGAKAKSKFAL